MSVKRILKFFIVILLTTIAIVGCAKESDPSNIKSQTNVFSSEIKVHYLESSISNIDLHLPSQYSSISNNVRAHNTVKRTCNGHKNNFEFVKGGKVINVCISNFIQRTFKHQHRFVKSASWLISLGKLVI